MIKLLAVAMLGLGVGVPSILNAPIVPPSGDMFVILKPVNTIITSSNWVYNQPFNSLGGGAYSYHYYNNGVDFTYTLEKPSSTISYSGKTYIQENIGYSFIGGYSISYGDVEMIIKNEYHKALRFTFNSWTTSNFDVIYDYEDYDYINNIDNSFSFSSAVTFKPYNNLLGQNSNAFIVPSGFSATLMSTSATPSDRVDIETIAYEFLNDEEQNFDYWIGYQDGYDDGHSIGFDDGLDWGTNGDMFGWVKSLFKAIGDIFSIPLFGDFTIGSLAMIMITFTLVPFILGMFKGGG